MDNVDKCGYRQFCIVFGDCYVNRYFAELGIRSEELGVKGFCHSERYKLLFVGMPKASPV